MAAPRSRPDRPVTVNGGADAGARAARRAHLSLVPGYAAPGSALPAGAPPDLAPLDSLVPGSPAQAAPSERAVRLPESVYRRRRAVVAAVAAVAVTLVLIAARPDRVPPGEVNLWPSAGDVSISTELSGDYVVQPGDTLWDIARALAPGRDARALVHELSETAGGGTLMPGQRILIDPSAASAGVAGPGGGIVVVGVAAVTGSGSDQRGAASAPGADR